MPESVLTHTMPLLFAGGGCCWVGVGDFEVEADFVEPDEEPEEEAELDGAGAGAGAGVAALASAIFYSIRLLPVLTQLRHRLARLRNWSPR